DPEALARLRRYTWPGNIRELQSVLKQALLQAHGPVLHPTFLPDTLSGAASAAPEEGPVSRAGAAEEAAFSFESFIQDQLRGGAGNLYAEAHQQLDRILLPLVLRFTEGNQFRAAQLLGIARQTLRARLRELNVSVVRTVEGGEEED